MKIYVFSELWNQNIELPDKEPDLVVHLGDSKREWVEKIDQKYHCRKLGLMGEKDNVNIYDGTDFENFHAQGEIIDGKHFFGLGGAPIHQQGNPPNQYMEYQIQEIFRRVNKIDVLFSHSNPAFANEGERNFMDSKRGFVEIGYLIEDGKLPYMVHGHVRQNYEFEQHGCKIISVHGFKEITI